MIGTTVFQGLAVSELGALGIIGLPLVMIEHPLGGERSEGIARRARQAVDQLTKALNTPTGATPGEIGRAEPGRTFLGPPSVQADLTDLATTDDPAGILAAFCEREWCDGLPIVPPTEARVQAMLAGAPADRSLGAMPPLWR